jgi:outer membrane protein OmpA-like peptidoglycan-associated protein
MQSLASAAIGDLRLGGKLLIVGGEHGHVGIDTTGSLPTGGGANLVGDDGTIITSRLVLDVRAGRLSLAANAGYAWHQRAARLANLYVDDELVWAGAAELALASSVSIGGSVYGRVGVTTDPMTGEMPSSVARPVEALGTLRYWMTRTIAFEAGGGGGIGDGYGAPSFRVLAGVRVVHRKESAPGVADRDHDGIVDRDDRCPTDPEDHDGFEDTDGCPDPDNDHDGNPDGTDKCPNEAEDTDGFEDSDGCPDLDNDHDGIADGPDLCPLVPEDKDGFQDDDGCPDPDNDGDGLLDAADKCPNEPETLNGYQDDDGCADAIPVQVKKYTGVISGITFESLSAEIVPSSYKVLDKAIQVLVDYPGINVEIQGHTDDVPIGVKSTFADNVALSQARADAVMRYLVKQGILEGRLTSKGYGDSRPIIAPGKLRGEALRAARAKNRRVEFAITPGASSTPSP